MEQRSWGSVNATYRHLVTVSEGSRHVHLGPGDHMCTMIIMNVAQHKIITF